MRHRASPSPVPHISQSQIYDTAEAPFRRAADISSQIRRFCGGARQKSILNGFALPVREDIFSDIGSLLVRHFIGVLRTARKVVHFIIDPFPRKFGCQNAAFSIFAACADNQLALKNIDAKLITGIIFMQSVYFTRKALPQTFHATELFYFQPFCFQPFIAFSFKISSRILCATSALLRSSS